MLVRPILEYGAVIWDPPSSSVSTSLESVQHFALKLISKIGLQITTHSSPNITCKLFNIEEKPMKSLLFKLKFNYCHSLSSPLVSPPYPHISLVTFAPTILFQFSAKQYHSQIRFIHQVYHNEFYQTHYGIHFLIPLNLYNHSPYSNPS